MWNSKIRSKLVGCLAYIHPIKNGFCSIPSLHIKRQKPWVQNRYIWYIIILSLYISLQDKPCRDFSVDFKGSRKSVVRWKIVPLVPCHFSSIYLSMVVTPPKKKQQQPNPRNSDVFLQKMQLLDTKGKHVQQLLLFVWRKKSQRHQLFIQMGQGDQGNPNVSSLFPQLGSKSRAASNLWAWAHGFLSGNTISIYQPCLEVVEGTQQQIKKHTYPNTPNTFRDGFGHNFGHGFGTGFWGLNTDTWRFEALGLHDITSPNDGFPVVGGDE